MLYQLVYVSSASAVLNRDALRALLEQSCSKNERLGITGMLLYREGNIMQVIEGEKAAVKVLYDRIARDARHHGLIVLTEGAIEQRNFAQWQMAFRDLTAPELRELPGYSDFLNTPLDAEMGAARALRLLHLFKAKM